MHENLMNTLVTTGGQWELYRWPRVRNDLLRAWDAADEYLIDHVFEHYFDGQATCLNTLVVNDSHGALTTALHQWQPVNWSDSFISQQSASNNHALNGLVPGPRLIPSSQTPEGPIDLLLIRIPKTNALLEDQLARLRGLVHADTRVVAAAMVKHLQKSAFECFEKYIGPVTTSLARKKARLLFARFDEALSPESSPYPTSYQDAAVGFPLSNNANVFSRAQLDHGSRFLLEHYELLPAVEKAVDLACGNGVLGLKYQLLHLDARMHYIDESHAAIDSSRANHASLGQLAANSAEFTVCDGMDFCAHASIDLIICNPPFHQQYVVGERMAVGLFLSAKRCLRQGGEMWVVANRHLGYPDVLQRMFGTCQTIACNRKFSVYKVVKR